MAADVFVLGARYYTVQHGCNSDKSLNDRIKEAALDHCSNVSPLGEMRGSWTQKTMHLLQLWQTNKLSFDCGLNVALTLASSKR